jgi:hypothetical protein
MGMPVLVICGIVALATLGNPLLIITWPLFIILAWLSWRAIKTARKDSAERIPQTIIVDSAGVEAGGRHYSASDIAEVQWAPPGADRPEQMHVLPDNRSHAAAYAMGQNIVAKIAHSSWVVMLRLRSDSRPVVIAHHLEPGTAEALGKDIISAMR